MPLDVWDALEASRLYEAGIPPIAGGQLDQAAKFAQAARFIRGEIQTWKATLNHIDDDG